METGERCWVLTCWLVLWLLSTRCSTSAHSEDIHDVCSVQGSSTGTSKWCSPSARQGSEVDVYEALWVENLDLVEQILQLPFLQHMQRGDLPADSYINFMIQDIYYLVAVTDMLEEMSSRVGGPPDLKEFLLERHQSYKRSSTQKLQEFNLNGVSDIKVIPAMRNYLDEYQRVMEQEEAIMMAVSLMPCSTLWVWLANHLDIGYGNAYWVWKKNNMYRNPEKVYRDLLNKYLKDDKKIKHAKEIFRKQMQSEHDFFKALVQN